jgi:epoxyqueuosine reductase
MTPPVPSTPLERALLVKARARELGFDLVGIADASRPLDVDHARYERALHAGLHGPIAYLEKNRAVRRSVDTPDILAGARSIVVVGARYDRDDDDDDPPIAQRIARYARGRDYHNHLRKKLRKLAAFVTALVEGSRARPMTDTAPVLERAWASRAGIGFVGKNGMVIAPGVGSEFLIGEVVTDVELEPDAPIEERCGSCTRCLDACPTKAFAAPFILDAGKCVSALTIELRGAVPDALRSATSEHLFGCDVCQDVCPFNAKSRPRGPLGDRYQAHARWSEVTVDELARVGMPGGRSFESVAGASPVHRATSDGLARNACQLLAVTGTRESVATLESVAVDHPSEVVRDAAAWALERLKNRLGDA